MTFLFPWAGPVPYEWTRWFVWWGPAQKFYSRIDNRWITVWRPRCIEVRALRELAPNGDLNDQYEMREIHHG